MNQIKNKKLFKKCLANLEKYIFKNKFKKSVWLFEWLINCKQLILVDISFNRIEKNKESVINFCNRQINGINYLC